MSANLISLTSAGGFSTTGNVVAGNIFGNGSQLTGIVASPSSNIVNGNSNVSVATGNGNVTITSNGTNTWNFDTTGNLIIPSSSGGLIKTEANGAIAIAAMNNGTDNPAQLMSWRTTENNPDTIVSTYANSATVMTNVTGTLNTWTFDNTGNLTLPGNMIVNGNINTLGTQTALLQPIDDLPLSFIATGANGSITSFWAEDFANLMTSNIAAVYTPLQNSQTVRIVTGNNGGNIAIYDFDQLGMFTTTDVCATGNIHAGNLILNSSIIGSGASPAPSINGFSSVSAVTLSASGNVTAGNVNTGVITLTNGAVIKDNAGNAVAFGQQAGNTSQGNYAVALGFQAAITSQGIGAVAIGREAGNAQGAYAVAIGQEAGFAGQSSGAIAIGLEAGETDQGEDSVAIGYRAGRENQDDNSVSIGTQAGQSSQGEFAVAIGDNAGNNAQGANAVALGKAAGQVNQGINSVAIGQSAGLTNQGNNSIILNATGSALEQTTANTFTVAPVRNDVANVAEVMFYNTTSKEITYGNVISVTGNITGNKFIGDGSQLTNVNAATVDVTNTNGLTTVYYPTFVENRTTAQIARADVDLTYRTDDNLLTVGNVSITGNITGNTAGFAIGYRDIPQVSFTGNATIATTDAGKHYYSTLSTGNVLTIANNASQSFQVGTAISIVNQGTGNITVAQGSGVTLYLAGNSTSGNRTVATFGMATIMKVATDTWFINGTGVS